MEGGAPHCLGVWKFATGTAGGPKGYHSTRGIPTPYFRWHSCPANETYDSIIIPHATKTKLVDKMGLENIAYVLGALTAGGGTMGYVKSGSVPSIAAGMTVGILYGLGGYRIQSREPYGVELALLASAVLGGSSIPRAIRLRKPVPSILSLVSIFGLYTFGTAFQKKL
ncbi:transmembrane proteins 14C-domain-containing protein [Xylariomycetidae sp. FL0641]|nr:transmembrane proteins 14C-domain-containing protein [Xylariomycetidae sp. FL0641]